VARGSRQRKPAGRVELIGREPRRGEPPRIAAILAVLGWTIVPVTALAVGWCAHLIVASEPGSVDPELLNVRIGALQRELINEARGDLASAVAELDVRNITLARDSLEEARRKLDVAQFGDPARAIPERSAAAEALRLVGSDDPADWQAARGRLAEAVGIGPPAVGAGVESESPLPAEGDSEF
jgi:hypothetical protein